MAGTPVIRSGPVASITPENFDGNVAPAENPKSLTGDMKNGLQPASFIVFSTGFTSNADQLVTPGTQICGNSMSVTMSDDTVKGPYHCSVISNCVGPVGAGVDAVSLYAENGTNGSYYHFFSSAEYTGGWKQLIADPSGTPDAGTALSVTATCTHVGMYMDSTTGGQNMFELVATAISWCGREIQIDGGTSTPGNEIDFNGISLRDRLTTRSTAAPITGQYYGHVEATEGIISLKGPVQLGDSVGTNNTYMLEKNTFCLWADNPVNTKFYRIDILSNGASNSTTVIWGDAATPAPVTIDAAGAINRWALDTATVEPDEFSAYGCTLKRGRAWGLGSTSTIDGGVLQNITDIAMNAAAMILNAQLITVRLDYAAPPTVGKLTASVLSSPSDFCMTISDQGVNTLVIDYTFDSSARGAGKAIEFTHTTGNIAISSATGYTNLVLADVTVSGAGTVTFVSTNTTITFAGLKDNSEVRVYDSGTGAEIAGIEDAIAGTVDNRTFAWSDVATNVVDYVIHNWQPGVTTYQTIRVNGFTVPSSDTTINIQQQIDRNAA